MKMATKELAARAGQEARLGGAGERRFLHLREGDRAARPVAQKLGGGEGLGRGARFRGEQDKRALIEAARVLRHVFGGEIAANLERGAEPLDPGTWRPSIARLDEPQATK